MHEKRWVSNLLHLTGYIMFVVAVIGLVVFVWGYVSPGRFSAVGRWIGYRPTGLMLLVGGYCGGLIFLGYAEIINLLGKKQ